MTESRKELREEVARKLYESCQDDVPGLRGPPWDELADSMKQNFRRDADAAIALVVERMAKELEGWGDIYGRNAAAAIRSLTLEEKP